MELLTSLRTHLASWLGAAAGGPGGDGGRGGSAPPSTPPPAFPDSLPPTPAAAGWSPTAERALLDTLRVPSFAAAQDVVNALAMSEIAYTMAEAGPAAALVSLRAARSSFPPGLMTVGAVQATRRHVPHSYVLGSAPGALLVAFAGTHAARDLLVDADIRQTEVWLGDGGGGGPATAAVHRGFLARARGVPVDLLAAHAAAHGRRLVLCGHSLGGAVAIMCTLNLLRRETAEEAGNAPVSCVSFAAPALGNAGLAALVASRPGWSDRFYNLAFPDDAVPRLLAATPAALAAADAAAGAGGGASGGGGADHPPAATISHQPFVPPSADAVPVDDKGGGNGSSRWAAWVPAVPAAAVPPAVTRAATAVSDAAARALPASVAAAWSTAAGRATVALPDYAHFGQHHSPPVPAVEIEEGWGDGERESTLPQPAAASTSAPTTSLAADVQARLASLAAALPAAAAALPDAITRVPGLAAHRVATYRDRVRTLTRAVPDAPRAWPDGAEPPPLPTLSLDVAPPLEPQCARALLPPLPPPSLTTAGPADAASGGLGSYWASVRRTAADLAGRAGGGGNASAATAATAAAAAAAAAAQVSLTILVRGRGLASASGARVGAVAAGAARAAPSSWFPAAIRRRPPPASIGRAGGGDAATMTVVARVPAAVLRSAAVEDGRPGRLSLGLRSDCAASTVPVSLCPRTAWLVWAGRPGGGLPPPLAALEPSIHNGVRYVAFDGPAAAWAALRALDRAGDGGGSGFLSGLRRWLAGGGRGAGPSSSAPPPPPFPDVVLALHEPGWLPGPRTAASLRDLAGRVRLAPVCCVGAGGPSASDEAAAAVASVSALYADGWLDRAPAVVAWGGEGGAAALAGALEGLVFRELLASSGAGAAPRL